MATKRFDALQELTPRRFHISANPPFGIGFVIFGHENQDIDEERLEQFFLQQEIICNCKPGIWTSRILQLEYVHEDAGDCDREAILYWVAEGSIDVAQCQGLADSVKGNQMEEVRDLLLRRRILCCCFFGVEMGVPEDRERFTIGGVNFSQDEVGGPPRIAVAEENGQVIAVRFYCGMEDWSAHGSEDGLSSEEEKSEVLDEDEEGGAFEQR
ncbi:hypothetical protein VTL71DRAFT_5155 [Oculimacula yallundae]|uniref:Uncharacterized protein n=1 Tax=Oculimacula yallundae TaxID=86028 RepID=A0ABR4C0G8_9HELO